MLDRIDQLITIGEYPNRSEAVRDSVRKLLDNKRVYNNVLNVSEKDLQKFIKITDK